MTLLTDAIREEIREMAALGLPAALIQHKLGVHWTTAVRYGAHIHRQPGSVGARYARVERMKAHMAAYPSIAYCYPEASLERAAG